MQKQASRFNLKFLNKVFLWLFLSSIVSVPVLGFLGVSNDTVILIIIILFIVSYGGWIITAQGGQSCSSDDIKFPTVSSFRSSSFTLDDQNYMSSRRNNPIYSYLPYNIHH